MECIQREDASRLSTEANAPFFQYRMTDTFVSSVDISSVNLLKVHFYLMYTFLPVHLRATKVAYCQI